MHAAFPAPWPDNWRSSMHVGQELGKWHPGWYARWERILWSQTSHVWLLQAMLSRHRVVCWIFFETPTTLLPSCQTSVYNLKLRNWSLWNRIQQCGKMLCSQSRAWKNRSGQAVRQFGERDDFAMWFLHIFAFFCMTEARCSPLREVNHRHYVGVGKLHSNWRTPSSFVSTSACCYPATWTTAAPLSHTTVP